jgi:hypothetical protein
VILSGLFEEVGEPTVEGSTATMVGEMAGRADKSQSVRQQFL